MEGPNLTPQEAADRLRVKPGTLAAWRYRGQGPRYIKVGKLVLYPLAEVEAYEARSLQVVTHVKASYPNDRRKP